MLYNIAMSTLCFKLFGRLGLDCERVQSSGRVELVLEQVVDETMPCDGALCEQRARSAQARRGEEDVAYKTFELLADDLHCKVGLAGVGSVLLHRCVMPMRCRVVGNRKVGWLKTCSDLRPDA